MPKKKERENLKPPFGAGSEDQCLEGFDGDDRSLNKQRSIGEQSSGGGSRKSRDKKQNSRSSKQESKIGSSTIERVRVYTWIAKLCAMQRLSTTSLFSQKTDGRTRRCT